MKEAAGNSVSISRSQMEILNHSLGLDQNGRGSFTRNHYCANGDDISLCRNLVSLGYMCEHPASAISGGDPIFTVTGIGIQMFKDRNLQHRG